MERSSIERGIPVLQATGLWKSYRGPHAVLEVLRGLDLTIERGTFLAILGASGAGKSTLLNILGTLDRPDAGSLLIDGQAIGAAGERELSRFRARRLGFVFQFHHLLPEFSAEENVMMPLLIGGERFDAARTRARALLDEVGLGERREHRPAELSGGEAQRVAVARALSTEPDLVLADEPSGNLDPRSAETLHELLASLKQRRHPTFVVVTHNDRLAVLADRVLRLEQGTLVETAATRG